MPDGFAPGGGRTLGFRITEEIISIDCSNDIRTARYHSVVELASSSDEKAMTIKLTRHWGLLFNHLGAYLVI